MLLLLLFLLQKWTAFKTDDKTFSQQNSQKPFSPLTVCKEKQGKKDFLSPLFLPHSPPPLSEKQRNFIEKMEGTGKTRVPGGMLRGFRLHQRLPLSAGR